MKSSNYNKEKIIDFQNDCAIVRIVTELIAFSNNIKDDILHPTRGNSKLAFARQIAMYLTHIGFGLSINRVAIAFGRDRSTVTYACSMIEDKRDDTNFDDYLDSLERILNEIPKPFAKL